MKYGDPIEEYKSLGENLRWYSNIRFAQLTLFGAITAVILSQVFETTLPLVQRDLVALKLGGFLSALIFGYMEIRADEYWSHFMKRAVELEDVLGYKQYSTRPVRKIRTTHLIRVLYVVIAIFWIISLLTF